MCQTALSWEYGTATRERMSAMTITLTPDTERLINEELKHDHYKDAEDVMVTTSWPLEITNGLIYAQRRGRMTAKRLEQFLEQLLRLRIQVEPCTTQQAVRAVRRLAQTHQLTAYDAAYLELAIRNNLPLATLDTELKKAAVAEGVRLVE